MGKCPACGQEMPEVDRFPVIDDEETLFDYMHRGHRKRDVYISKNGDWRMTYSGDLPKFRAISPTLVRSMIREKKLFPKFDGKEGYLWDQPKTILMDQTAKMRRKHGKDSPWVYRDLNTGEIFEDAPSD